MIDGKRHDLVMADNRDVTTTLLHLSDRSEVQINPVELFTAMLQNLPSPLDEQYEVAFNKFMISLELEMDVYHNACQEGEG